MNQPKKKAPVKKPKTGLIAIIGLAVVIVAIGIVLLSNPGVNTNNQTAFNENSPQKEVSVNETPANGETSVNATDSPASGKDIVIDKSKITEKATFFPYQAGDIEMEVLAVKAPDGTIRTAMNTCQVCYDSGAGYYIQEGDELVCQNCGNRFNISKIERQKNGCNPVPITSEYKTETDSTITIPGELLEAAKELFADWKR